MPKQRDPLDFFPTPAWVTQALLDRVKFDGLTLEPAYGDGRMANVLKLNGLAVITHDIKDYGAGVNTISDFIKLDMIDVMRPYNVITNPPFRTVDYRDAAMKFITKAFRVATKKVAMLLPVRYEAGLARGRLFQKYPPALIITFSRKIDFFGLGNPRDEFSWYVWENESTGDQEAFTGEQGKTRHVWCLDNPLKLQKELL